MDIIAAERAAALVLTVGLDELTLGRVAAALSGTELLVQSVSPEEAVERAQTEEGPIVALLEWTAEQEEEQTLLCEALRRATRPGWCYLVALGGLSDPALSRAMDGAVNDVLNRPFGGEVLLRLRQGVRLMQSTHVRVTPRDALDEALKSTSGGEVAVRSGDVVSYIHVQNGFIVWANLSSVPATMEEVARHAGVDFGADVIAAAKEECRTTRAHFMDVLVSWKLIDPERAKEAVRTFVAERVKLVLELPNASALFLPKARQYTEHLRFSADEIPSVRRPPLMRSTAPFSASPPSSRAPLPLGDISALFQEAMKIEGAISVAILDRKTGASLQLSGAKIDTGIAWSQLSLLKALGPHAEDVIGSAGEHCFVTRPLHLAPALALFVVLSQSATTIGLARSMVARIASTRALSLAAE
jgi:hypothetical protein